MILYHFCCERDFKGIMREGLSKGTIAIPYSKGYLFRVGWQWITTDPDPAHQNWATRNLVRYSRTAWRLTLDIPEVDAEARMFDRKRLKAIMPEVDFLFEGWPGSDCWRVYHGYIPRKWIVAAERMTP